MTVSSATAIATTTAIAAPAPAPSIATRRRRIAAVACLLLAAVSMSGCERPGGAGGNPDAEAVRLVWYIRSAKPEGADAVMERVNEWLLTRMQATLEMRYINPGDYDSTMQLALASNEQYDLAFTSSWTNSFLDNVSRGAYRAIDELIEPYPELRALFRPEVWEAAKVSGKLYALPNNQIMAGQDGIWFHKGIADKYGLQVQAVRSLDDLGELYRTLRERDPEIIPLRAGFAAMHFRERHIPDIDNIFSVDTRTWTVYDRALDHLDAYEAVRRWYLLGYLPPDVATMKEELSLVREGRIFSRYNRQKPGSESELQTTNGFEVETIDTSEPVIARASVLTALTAISATSQHPEKAMELLYLVNTDKTLYNLLANGIEDVDYVRVSEERIEPLPGRYTMQNWMLGNVFNSYLLPGQPDDVWEQTRQINESAYVDPLISFTLDRTGIEREMQRLTEIEAQFRPVLENGLDDPGKMLELREQLRREAGADRAIAEAQRQIDVWRGGRTR